MTGEFDVGFVHTGNTIVSIRNSQDLTDIWSDIIKGKNHILWCDGLNDGKKREVTLSVMKLTKKAFLSQGRKRRQRIRKNKSAKF